MAESRGKSESQGKAGRHLSRVTETGAALLHYDDADSPPAKLVNAHVSAIRTLAGESEAADAVCLEPQRPGLLHLG